MSLVSRDQGPPRTPHEAELREQLREAEERAAMYERLAIAQDRVVQAAQAALPAETGADGPFAPLAVALQELERERGRILLDSMPPELRASLTGPSLIERALVAQGAVAIVAILESPEGTERWSFDFAPDVGTAFDKLRQWNERASRDWPDMRFSLATAGWP